MIRVTACALSATAALVFTAGLSGTANATPPNIPSASVARTELAGLTVAAETHDDTYDRSLFPHWITISGSCNTRETVLKRDGQNVQTGSDCAATSGTWDSPYDGGHWTAASDVDIDHMVPLKEAWRSGAWAWTTAKRQDFANDLTDPQLWAVTDNVNQAKGDDDPANWKPPTTSFYCTYARAYTHVKHAWALTVDSAEKTAIGSMLDTC
ncbi:HNH endonuclease [Actinomadura barringtoniae]|uniref:HNH endonuclease n=1 Tax=Actinomadura barringtoniae TaxID=1427535 RepID=A0A939TAF9_9ACTN|nr:HNH endonuclease family protein [Actinomadura barringtoniae]MBO2455364.1 HNH endonuclease [Actinomadura barringtoniae]